MKYFLRSLLVNENPDVFEAVYYFRIKLVKGYVEFVYADYGEKGVAVGIVLLGHHY